MMRVPFIVGIAPLFIIFVYILVMVLVNGESIYLPEVC